MQLAYLFHQCVKSLLSRDSRIADCTVRHPGVSRPFSSYYAANNKGNADYYTTANNKGSVRILVAIEAKKK